MIGYYVHHHGHGHVARASAVGAYVDEPIVYFSSLPQPPVLRPSDRWVRLPMDIDPSTAARDADAHGLLHWAPLNVDGLLRRSRAVLDTIAAAGVRKLVVDVSVEIAVLARTAGIPITVLAMPGDRDDAPHQLAYGLAEQIIAPWAKELYQPRWLVEHACRTHYVGAISRFDAISKVDAADRRSRSDTNGLNAVLLFGTGGADIPCDALDRLERALPQYRWTALGGRWWTDDPWTVLRSASLIVTHAGQNALADSALSAATTIVLPQPRPYREQHTTAEALARAGVVVTIDGWPDASAWRRALDAALELAPDRWAKMRVEGAAERAGQVIAA